MLEVEQRKKNYTQIKHIVVGWHASIIARKWSTVHIAEAEAGNSGLLHLLTMTLMMYEMMGVRFAKYWISESNSNILLCERYESGTTCPASTRLRETVHDFSGLSALGHCLDESNCSDALTKLSNLSQLELLVNLMQGLSFKHSGCIWRKPRCAWL